MTFYCYSVFYRWWFPFLLLVIALAISCGTATQSFNSSPVSDIGRTPTSSYQIGPEDVLHISVWENKELTLENVVVRPDGKISMPLIQDVPAEGLTTAELAEQIRQKLSPYIKDPVVSVIVKAVNSAKFFIVGYVNRPGTYPLHGDLSVLQALSMAGGLTQFASPKKIRLVRSRGKDQEIYIINYYDVIGSGEGNYLLKPGDTIVVP